MTIMAIAGRRRTGKTTSAEIICSLGAEMGIPITKISFADPIRAAFSRDTGIGEHMLYNPDTKEEFRERLTKFSEEQKATDPFIWINALNNSLIPGQHYVVDDLRSLQELEFIVKIGGKPFKVDASKDTREKRGYKYNRAVDEHISETEMDLCNHTFYTLGGGGWYNNKTIEDLRVTLTPIVKEVFAGRVLV